MKMERILNFTTVLGGTQMNKEGFVTIKVDIYLLLSLIFGLSSLVIMTTMK